MASYLSLFYIAEVNPRSLLLYPRTDPYLISNGCRNADISGVNWGNSHQCQVQVKMDSYKS